MLPAALSQSLADHQNLLWVMVVCLDLGLTLLLFRTFGKMGLYGVVVLNILLCNLIGPKITVIFGLQTSMGVILYSGIYFATDLLGERYGKREANRAVLLGFAASVTVVVMALLCLEFTPLNAPDAPGKTEFAQQAHGALSTLFTYTPRFVFGSLLAYIISQTHDVWMFHFLKRLTNGKHLWLRNNVSTITSQALDTVVYAVVVWNWILGDIRAAFVLAGAKYFFKVIIALMDTPFIYWARDWDISKRDWQDPGHLGGKPENGD